MGGGGAEVGGLQCAGGQEGEPLQLEGGGVVAGVQGREEVGQQRRGEGRGGVREEAAPFGQGPGGSLMLYSWEKI